jgi:outer membrane protein OmpA-like peptidoglycan-associated protein
MSMLHTLYFLYFLVTLECLAQESGSVASPKIRILDLKFKVENMSFQVEDMSGKVENLQVKETATEVRVKMAADVLFDFDKAIIKVQAEATLLQAAALIHARNKGNVRVEGHTDAKGSDSYNQRLSQHRAEAVRNWLAVKGAIDPTRLTSAGFGAKVQVAPNTRPDGSDDPEGRRRNRRVELIISK